MNTMLDDQAKTGSTPNPGDRVQVTLTLTGTVTRRLSDCLHVDLDQDNTSASVSLHGDEDGQVWMEVAPDAARVVAQPAPPEVPYTPVWIRGGVDSINPVSGPPGSFQFTPPPRVLRDIETGRIVPTSPLPATTDPVGGPFEIQALVTDDPADQVYTVTEPTGRIYTFVVSPDAPILDSPGDPLHGQRVLHFGAVLPAPRPATLGSPR